MIDDTTRAEDDLRAVAERLQALSSDGVRPVHADPHALAIRALLVADYVQQSELAAALSALTSVAMFREAAPGELRQLARALLTYLEPLAGDYLPDGTVAQGLIDDSVRLRRALVGGLERALPTSADVRLWLDAVRRGSGAVDLVYDLRTLAVLYEEQAETIERERPGLPFARLVSAARVGADTVEHALTANATPEQRAARDSVLRAWTLLVPCYAEVVEAATFVARKQGRARPFPSLAVVAAHRRARRSPLTMPPPPGGVSTTETNENRLPVDLSHVSEVIEILRSEPPRPMNEEGASAPVEPTPPPMPLPRVTEPPASNSRRAARHGLEIEVDIVSDTNFYVGFTENLSEGGVFVATYLLKPIGSRIELDLALPSGDTLQLEGTVRWLREASNDAWPGMGVQFDSLRADDEVAIKRFLKMREPLFYGD